MKKNNLFDSSDLAKAYVRLNKSKPIARLAMMRALNRTLDHTATITKREVSNVYAVNQRSVGETFTKHKAAKTSLKAYLNSKGKRLDLSSFRIKPSRYSKSAKSVQVRIKKGDGLKTINTSPKAFVQSIYGEDPKVYKRKDGRRFPVVVLKTLAIPQMIEQTKVEEKIKRQMAETLDKRLLHELNREIGKAVNKK